MTAEEFNNMSEEEQKVFSDNLCEETFKEWDEEIRQQQEETEHEAAQYSEDGKSLIKYKGNAESYAVREGTENICEEAFSGNNTLKKIIIPKSIKCIDSTAFNKSYRLEALEVEEGNDYFHSKDGVLYRGNFIVRFPTAKKQDVVTLTQSIIREYSFYRCCGIKRVNFEPDKNKSLKIEEAAFYGSSNIKIFHFGLFSRGVEISNTAFTGMVFQRYWAILPQLINNSTICIPDPNRRSIEEKYPIFEDDYEVIMDNESAIYSAGGMRLVRYMGQSHIYKIKEGTKIINSTAFHNMHNLVSLTIPKSVEFIQKEAIKGCENLCHIYIEPGNVGGYVVDGNQLQDRKGEVVWKFNKGY